MAAMGRLPSKHVMPRDCLAAIPQQFPGCSLTPIPSGNPMALRYASTSNAMERGFTILEISIVLVIIALIVGGIFIGRDLIHAAELRAVMTQVDQFKVAVNTFQIKYNCLPGDCPFATNFWGTDPGGCPLTPNNTTPKTATCNGNGDGRIYDDSIGNTYGCEQYRFWQHLANAQLIPGFYVGAQAAGVGNCVNDGSVGGLSVPKGKISESVFTVTYFGDSDAMNWGSLVPANVLNKNFISFSPDTLDANVNGIGIVSPLDAYNIDSKIDDGHAGSGSVLAQAIVYEANDVGYCTKPPWAWPTDYDTAKSTTGACGVVSGALCGCGLLFDGGF
jgi:prepilin-type N-terminal cleavage/methylation domain-containing protein